MPESIDDALTEGENFDGKGTSELNNLKSVGAEQVGVNSPVVEARGPNGETRVSVPLSDHSDEIFRAANAAISDITPAGGVVFLPPGEWKAGEPLKITPGVNGIELETPITVRGVATPGENNNQGSDYGTTVDASALTTQAIEDTGNNADINYGKRVEDMRVIGDQTQDGLLIQTKWAGGSGWDNLSIQKVNTAIDSQQFFFCNLGSIFLSNIDTQCWINRNNAIQANGVIGPIIFSNVTNPDGTFAFDLDSMRGNQLVMAGQDVDHEFLRISNVQGAKIGPIYTEQMNNAGTSGDETVVFYNASESTFGPWRMAHTNNATIRLGDAAGGNNFGFNNIFRSIRGPNLGLASENGGEKLHFEGCNFGGDDFDLGVLHKVTYRAVDIGTGSVTSRGSTYSPMVYTQAGKETGFAIDATGTVEATNIGHHLYGTPDAINLTLVNPTQTDWDGHAYIDGTGGGTFDINLRVDSASATGGATVDVYWTAIVTEEP